MIRLIRRPFDWARDDRPGSERARDLARSLLGMSRPRDPIPPHGERRRYYHRAEPCRCPACRQANAAYVARTRGTAPRVVPPTDDREGPCPDRD